MEDDNDQRQYAWWGGKIWFDTGMRDHLGRASLWSLSEDGAGVNATKWTPVTGKELESCRRIWG